MTGPRIREGNLKPGIYIRYDFVSHTSRVGNSGGSNLEHLEDSTPQRTQPMKDLGDREMRSGI